MSKFFTTRSLVVTALMIALSVILRLLGFPQDGVFRIEFGFLPIAITGFLFGPVVGGISYVAADIVGTLFTGMAPYPPITMCKLLMGIVFGLFFYKKKISLFNIILANIIIMVFIDLIAMPICLLPISGEKGLVVILTERVIVSFINVPLRILSIWFSLKRIDLKKIGGGKIE